MENVILNKSSDFALEVIKYCETLEEKKKYVISNQLLKSGISIGANICKAQNSESKPDFIHKIKIAAQEAEETEYWLLLCKHSSNYPESEKLLTQLIENKKIMHQYHSNHQKIINSLAN